jgi:hypothetical protein
LSLYISPEVCFASNLPRSCKMVYLLIFIHKIEF